MAPRHHLLDIYDVWIHAATNRRDWSTLRRKTGGMLDKPDGMGFTAFTRYDPPDGTKSDHHYFVYLDLKQHGDGMTELVNTCGHEAAHVASDILTTRKVPIEGEALAYLVGWLTGWLWDATL